MHIIAVAPLAGAWIEILFPLYTWQNSTSLPSRERGLKLKIKVVICDFIIVAPLAGAWIEISLSLSLHSLISSLPSRERGLKLMDLF